MPIPRAPTRAPVPREPRKAAVTVGYIAPARPDDGAGYDGSRRHDEHDGTHDPDEPDEPDDGDLQQDDAGRHGEARPGA